jgi:hypothetical protein
VLDKDGSGYIDREELVAALDKYGDLSDLDTILKQVRGGGWGEQGPARVHQWSGHNIDQSPATGPAKSEPLPCS